MTLGRSQADLLNGLSQCLLRDRGDYPGRHIAENVLSKIYLRPGCAEARAPELDLNTILATASKAALWSEPLGLIGAALQALTPSLLWTQRDTCDPSASAGFSQAHCNAVIAGPGPGSLWRSEGYSIGVSIALPQTTFPLHSHAPEELYLTLTEADFRHSTTGWQTCGIGQTFHNTPGIFHAMRSRTGPMVALWLMGDTAA